MRVPWNRGGIRWYLIFLGLVAGRPSTALILAGVPLLLLGIALHLWAKGCLHQNQEVTTSGPYRYVRHPFYLGNLLVDLAVVIMSGSLLLAGVFPIWWALVYIPTMRREEATLAGLFGEKYRQYARRVPLLFPTARPIPAGPGFSWRNPNIPTIEVPRALRFLSYPFLFLLAGEWRKSGLSFPPALTTLTFYALLAVLSVNVMAWQVKRIALGGKWPRPSWLFGPYARATLLLAILVVGTLVTRFKAEPSRLMIPLGAVLVCLSLLIHFRRPRQGALDRLLLLVGASSLWGLPWLATAPLLLYSGDLLVARLSPTAGPSATESSHVKIAAHRSAIFLLILTICLCSAVVKRLATDAL